MIRSRGARVRPSSGAGRMRSADEWASALCALTWPHPRSPEDARPIAGVLRVYAEACVREDRETILRLTRRGSGFETAVIRALPVKTP